MPVPHALLEPLIMRFEFATADRVVFGPGTAREVGRLLLELLPAGVGGRSILVVAGRDVARAEPVLSCIRDGGLTPCVFQVPGEPTIELVERGIELARRNQCCAVVGFGGGSVIDAGKAIAVLADNPGEVLDYIEIIGKGVRLAQPGLPYVAVPTTAGTGAEVTRNAVIASPQHGVKASLRSAYMLPRLAVVDPELTYSLPPAVSAATGLDALTQLIEPFVSNWANPMTDGLCREGIARVARSLRRACERGDDAAAREDMCVAALFGGMALANAGLGAVHGLAGPIGGEFPAPHGAVCAALLPQVMAANVRAMREREPSHPALACFADIARIVTSRDSAGIDDGVEWVRLLVLDLHIPPLESYGIKPSHVDALVVKAMGASSMRGNPIALMPEELKRALLASL
jgi:alcohol dehydrogenase class IV